MQQKDKLRIRPYKLKDWKQIGQLFYETVHSINRRDYSETQVKTWAPIASKEGIFSRPLEKSYCFVAEMKGLIVGFGDITKEGYLDRLFVHKDYQRQGIGSLLLATLEAKAKSLHITEVRTDASVTAKPFFLVRGYCIKMQQLKTIKGVSFVTFSMYKKL